MNGMDLRELLSRVSPTMADYDQWTQVGMALKHEGYPVEAWIDWSAGDPSRFHRGECEKKWETFQGSENPVTGGTIYQLAREQGWIPAHGHELTWDDTIRDDPQTVIDKGWVESREVEEPAEWDPARQVIEYLETLFEAGENVGYLMQSFTDKDGKRKPRNRGNYDRTAGQLIEALTNCNGRIEDVLGDYDPEGGAWVRFNPLDGQGVRNANVSDYRYALVESDSMDVTDQNALLRELELPIAVMVHSGGKSLHAIVRVDAPDYREYQKRVEYLYSVCEKNGITIDKQNKNPSRLSRLPGVMRAGRKQFIVARNIGKKDWAEWREWVEGVNDSLPDLENLGDVWNGMPELAPELIGGVLRKGHKMLLAGPSKSGKSFLLIELCIAIAEGRRWLGWQCAGGNVLYVNLELDRASCLRRFKDVYEAMGVKPEHLGRIDIWNLRGRSVPMDQLAPKLIRRAEKKDCTAIIIDPIYKVITGDENSADQMARFCNQFDRVCTELGCAVIYCHHHSKGAQGGKRSMDRASGSGVFARDPDALIDMIELEPTDALIEQEANKAACAEIRRFLEHRAVTGWDWREEISQDDWLNHRTLVNICENSGHLIESDMDAIRRIASDARRGAEKRSAWRLEGTLREFAPFEPVNVWFNYPAHRMDESGALRDIQPEEEKPPWQKGKERRSRQADEQRTEFQNSFIVAFDGMVDDKGLVSLEDISSQIGVTERTARAWFKDNRYKNTWKDVRKNYSITKIDDVQYIKKNQ